MRVLIFSSMPNDLAVGSVIRGKMIELGLLEANIDIGVVSWLTGKKELPVATYENFFDFYAFASPVDALAAGIETFKPDIIFSITHGLLNVVRLMAKKYSIPYVVDLHAIRSLEIFFEHWPFNEKVNLLKQALSWEYAIKDARSITVANPMLAKLVSRFTRKAVMVAGIIDPIFANTKARIETEKISLLYAGNGLPYQGLKLLLDTVSILPEHIFNILQCNIILTEWVDEKLMQQLDELAAKGKINLQPSLSFYAYAELLKQNDIFVVPRHNSVATYLAFPQKLVESLAAGCCVLASDIAPHRYAIKPGYNGLLFKTTPQDFSQKIIESCESSRLRYFLSENAAKLADEMFSQNGQCSIIIDVLQSACN